MNHTQLLRCQTQDELEQFPCFWLRGLIPNEWIKLPPPVEQDEITVVGSQACNAGNMGLITWQGCRKFFTDGSGGEQSSNATLRRCAWSFCCIAADLNGDQMEIDFGFYGPLPGPFQSVPRAEFYALLKFLLLTDGETILYTDNKSSVWRNQWINAKGA